MLCIGEDFIFVMGTTGWGIGNNWTTAVASDSYNLQTEISMQDQSKDYKLSPWGFGVFTFCAERKIGDRRRGSNCEILTWRYKGAAKLLWFIFTSSSYLYLGGASNVLDQIAVPLFNITVVKICAWCSFREFDKSTKEVHRRFLCRDHRAWDTLAAVWFFLYDPVYSVHGSIHSDDRSSIHWHKRYTQGSYSFLWGCTCSDISVLTNSFSEVLLPMSFKNTTCTTFIKYYAKYGMLSFSDSRC